MAGGFGSLPSLADLAPSDLSELLARIQGQQAEMQAQPGSPDRLVFDRAAMGGGVNPFVAQGPDGPATTGSTPNVPVAMSEADTRQMERGMMPRGPASAPRVSGMNPDAAPGMPGLPAQPSVTAASTGNADASNVAPVNSFDPLTGQPVSGNPKPMQAPGQGGPSEGAARVAAAAGNPASAGPGGSFFERFAKGLNNPAIGDLLFNVGIGLMSNRGFGPGIAAGLQGYQANQGNQTKQLLQQYQLMQQIQGQNAIRTALAGKGLSQPMIEAAALNPTVLSSVLSQQNKDPQTIDVGGNRYLVPPGGRPGPDNLLGPSSGPPSGFQQTPNGLAPIEGGPQSIGYKAAEAGAVAKAKDEAVGSKPIQVRPGSVLIDPATNKPVYEAPGNKPQGFETEEKLRGDFNKQLTSFNQVHNAYGSIVAATQDREKNPGKTSPAADMSLIFGYMKMLDPGSVVREGEYATAQNATGVPDRVLNAYNKLVSGESLNDEQRRDFLDQSQKLYGRFRKDAENTSDYYKGLAKQYGVEPDRVARLPETPQVPKIGGQGMAAPDAAVKALQGNPSLRDQFEAKYGRGSAARYLGGQ